MQKEKTAVLLLSVIDPCGEKPRMDLLPCYTLQTSAKQLPGLRRPGNPVREQCSEAGTISDTEPESRAFVFFKRVIIDNAATFKAGAAIPDPP